MIKFLLLALSVASLSLAQDNSDQDRTIPFSVRSDLPSKCKLGQVITRKDLSPGSNVYICGASNNWALLGSGGAPGSPTNSVQFNNAGSFTGDTNLLWDPALGLFIGGDRRPFLGAVGIAVYRPDNNVDNYWGFKVPNSGDGYVEQGYVLSSATNSQTDLFYTGVAAKLNSSGNVTDQAYFIESNPDYLSEISVRKHLVVLRNASRFCWNSVDDAGGRIFSSAEAAPAPDACIQRPSAGVAEFNNGTQGQLITVKALANFHTPASSSEACIQGQTAEDASFHYTCTATNTWKRVALSSF